MLNWRLRRSRAGSGHYMVTTVSRTSPEQPVVTQDIPAISDVDGKPFEPRFTQLVFSDAPIAGSAGMQAAGGGVGASIHTVGGGFGNGTNNILGFAQVGSDGWSVSTAPSPSPTKLRLVWTRIGNGKILEGVLLIIGRRS